MSSPGQPRVQQDNHLFELRVEGVTHARFTKCSAIAWEFEEITYRESMSATPAAKDPGLLNYDDVTLERGAVSNDSDLYDWSELVINAATNVGAANPDAKKTVDLVIKDRSGRTQLTWRLHNAWPKRTETGGWDAEGSSKTIDKTTLTFDRAERIAA